jgi:hypothetical protein
MMLVVFWEGLGRRQILERRLAEKSSGVISVPHCHFCVIKAFHAVCGF